jgi:CRP-like cAMP-binding protein
MTGTEQKQLASLHEALSKAVASENTDDAIDALQQLEKADPTEARWPHQLGAILQCLGRLDPAEQAYSRALERFVAAGLLPQAVAVAKQIVAINPARADLLDEIGERSPQSLRGARLAAATGPAEPAAADEPSKAPLPAEGVVDPAAAPAAKPLEPAADAGEDEVRFADVPDHERHEIEAPDIEVMVPTEPGAPESIPPQPASADAERLSQLSAAKLFGEVSVPVLVKLARAAELTTVEAGQELVRKGARADALFVIIEGTARVALPWLRSGGVDLAQGQVFGETCLLEGARRQTDVMAKTKLLLLRISTPDLRRIAAEHPELQKVLFRLLVRRQVANALQTSPLFSAFDVSQRKALARMFEVRRATPGVALQVAGKRSDGFYLVVVGRFSVEAGQLFTRLPPGSMIGHESLLSHAPATRTIVAETEALVLRMPEKKFSAFAAHYPPALAHLTELAARPQSFFRGDSS